MSYIEDLRNELTEYYHHKVSSHLKFGITYTGLALLFTSLWG